jgi:hypothetical protein
MSKAGKTNGKSGVNEANEASVSLFTSSLWNQTGFSPNPGAYIPVDFSVCCLVAPWENPSAHESQQGAAESDLFEQVYTLGSGIILPAAVLEAAHA